MNTNYNWSIIGFLAKILQNAFDELIKKYLCIINDNRINQLYLNGHFKLIIQNNASGFGDYQINIFFELAKLFRTNAFVLAEEFVENASSSQYQITVEIDNCKHITLSDICLLSVTKPAFVNITISDDFIFNHLLGSYIIYFKQHIQSNDSHYRIDEYHNKINNIDSTYNQTNKNYDEKIKKIQYADDILVSHYQNYQQTVDNNHIKKHRERLNNVVIDYSSPNLAKAMHVGHLRSTIIGDSISRVYEYLKFSVVRVSHVGDWGTQFGMLIANLIIRYKSLATQIHRTQQLNDKIVDSELNNHALEYSNPLINISQLETVNLADILHMIDKYTIHDLEALYVDAKHKFDEDDIFAVLSRELVMMLQNKHHLVYGIWKRLIDISIEHCLEIYKILDVQLYKRNIAGESIYNDLLQIIIDKLAQSNMLVDSQGAKCIFLENNQQPVIVQKQDGAYLYATTDLAAIYYRSILFRPYKIIYVVDSRQSLHFNQIFTIAKKSKILLDEKTNLHHVAFGTIMNQDGKPFKTRDGGTIKLLDLIKEAKCYALQIIEQKYPNWHQDEQVRLANHLAIASIKYADLSKHHTSDYKFCLQQMISLEGNTAPYILYTFVRIMSIFAKFIGQNNYDHNHNNIHKHQNKNNYNDANNQNEAHTDNNKNSCDITLQNALHGNTASIESKLVAYLKHFSEKIISEKIKLTFHHKLEKELLIKSFKFHDLVLEVQKEHNIHYICNYLFDLAEKFSRFYEMSKIIGEEKGILYTRLLLCVFVASSIHLGLSMLGIATIEKM